MVSKSRQFIVLTEFITKVTDRNQKLLGFPGGSVVKILPAIVEDMGLIPGLGSSHKPQGNWSLCATTSELQLLEP